MALLYATWLLLHSMQCSTLPGSDRGLSAPHRCGAVLYVVCCCLPYFRPRQRSQPQPKPRSVAKQPAARDREAVNMQASSLRPHRHESGLPAEVYDDSFAQASSGRYPCSYQMTPHWLYLLSLACAASLYCLTSRQGHWTPFPAIFAAVSRFKTLELTCCCAAHVQRDI